MFNLLSNFFTYNMNEHEGSTLRGRSSGLPETSMLEELKTYVPLHTEEFGQYKELAQ